jgi:hypothetical protein
MRRTIVLSSLVTSAVWAAMTLITVTFVFPAIVDAQVARITASGLTVVGPNNLTGINADVRATGGGVLTLLGADGKTSRISLGCCGSPGGQPPILENAGLSINDINGKQIGRIGTLDQVSPPVVVGTELRDAQNNVRYRASVDEDGNPSIQLFDADGNIVWSAP